ncbi:MAG: hypothetical protein ACRC0X_02185 [Brevinema sp.]
MQRFKPEVFINSLAGGSAQKNNPYAKLISYITTAFSEVLIKSFSEEIIPEKDIDNPLWNPVINLDKWVRIFRIQDIITNYTPPTEYINYLVRFYNRLLMIRPYPIATQKINKLFQEYDEFGITDVVFNQVFTLNKDPLNGDVGLGFPSSGTILRIDQTKKFSEYYPATLKLLQKILPITAVLQVDVRFSHGKEYPPYDEFLVIHHGNTVYQSTETALIYPRGSFDLIKNPADSLVKGMFIINDRITFDVQNIIKDKAINPLVYLSVFINNINAPLINVELTLGDRTSKNYQLSDLSVNIWTSVLIAMEIPAQHTIVDVSFFSENQFALDELRIHIGNNKSNNIYINKSINTLIIKDYIT